MKQTVLAKSFIGAAASLVLGVAFVNCSSNSPDSIGAGTGNNSGGGGAGLTTSVNLPDASTSGSSGAGGNGGGATPNPDANCGSSTSTASKMPTDVVLILDRSGSMSESIAEDCCCDNTCAKATGLKTCADTTNCTQRWPALTSAVTATISKASEVRWALKLFSSPSSSGSSSCTVNTGVEVQFGRPTGDITAAITGATPGGATPTAKAITTATAYLKTVNDQNSKVILLATDGEPNCAGGSSQTKDEAGTVTAAQAALAAGFKVYVIGIGPAGSISNLDSFAQAGGTGKYYPATSADDLAKALLDISKAVSDCTFTINPGKNGDVNNLAVYVDGSPVAKDPANGWSVGSSSTQVVINGSTCEKLKAGTATQVQVWIGCPGSPPPPLL